MPRTAVTPHATLDFNTPWVQFDGSVAGTAVASADGGVISGWTRDDILVCEGSAAGTDLTIPVNSEARGRINDQAITISNTVGRLIVPLRLFPPVLFAQVSSFEDDRGELHLDVDTGDLYVYMIRVENPLRGGAHAGTGSPGLRDEMTVNELNGVGETFLGIAAGDQNTSSGLVISDWTHDDIVFKGTLGTGNTESLPISSSNPVGRTNAETLAEVANSNILLHLGCMKPEMWDQGGQFFMDSGGSNRRWDLVRASYLW